MLELIDTPPHKIVFLGPGCSVATTPVAEAAPYWQAVQVSVIKFTVECVIKNMMTLRTNNLFKITYSCNYPSFLLARSHCCEGLV